MWDADVREVRATERSASNLPSYSSRIASRRFRAIISMFEVMDSHKRWRGEWVGDSIRALPAIMSEWTTTGRSIELAHRVGLSGTTRPSTHSR